MTRLQLVGLMLILAIVTLAAIGPAITPSPNELDLASALQAPSLDSLLGTDGLGRSVAARLATGARTSLLIAVTSMTIALVLSTGLALAAALVPRFRGPIRWLLDIFQAFPSFVGILLLSGIFPPTPLTIAVNIALVSWPEPCRVALLAAESAMRSTAVEAAALVRLPRLSIALKLVLPRLADPLAALGAMLFGQAILQVAALGFLGLGLNPPAPEWGTMIAEALPYIADAPYLLIAPSAAIMASVGGMLLLADRAKA
ncbi:ABC transporter permease [Bradyrhizobium ontarionense]|uniref:ABC transporter permease n=1 Tax=Bradyrhizobium ontarionense TaxID=2898149 RepID=A0ABY3R5R6_9BRAD|nr:ABC transporter permease [Bradyrhizobium sp. A19]UFZ02648.1 ABC transporter permease [Bradyrhizobium sp. A19]